MGPELMQVMRDQAERFGARFLTDNATRVEPAEEEGGLHTVWVDDESFQARTVILAMGAEHKKLGVPGEDELANGRGVSYCATCDAAFFKDRETIIVGGGDSAMEEAIFLAKFSSKVTIVHRRDEFRASQIMLDRAKAMENVEFLDALRRRGVPGRRERRARLGAAAQRRDRRGARDPDVRARSSRSGTSRSRRSSRGSSTPTPTATSPSTGAPPARTCRACSPPATSSTTPTARRSRPPARAARRRWTPSGTCATTRCPDARGAREHGRPRQEPVVPSRACRAPVGGAARLSAPAARSSC